MLNKIWLALGFYDKDKSRDILSDVPEDKAFWTNDGRILRNLQELSGALNDISEEAFSHHVNGDKNDFSNWINDVIGDQKLAKDIAQSKSKEIILKKVNKRNERLKKMAGK